MIIGIDAMGGDFAPDQAVLGAIQAKQEDPTVQILLLGDQAAIEASIQAQGGQVADFAIVHTSDVIGMGEHPTKAIAQKPNSSIMVGFHLLKEGKINAFIGAGNTGAMLVGAIYSVKPIEGVSRPTIATIIPKFNGKLGLLLDVGANADCKPETLTQFAVLGSLYAQHVFKIENPKVGLVNIGEEKEKGNILAQATYPLLESHPGVDFYGNVEGRDIFLDKVDVMVCDGFTGNVILKNCESIYYYLVMKKGIQDSWLDSLNFENYGGTPILGVNAPVIIGHGISKAKAFKNMVHQAKSMVSSGVIEKIKTSFLVPSN